MNPIKTHLLDRLRPKDRTMTTMTDEEAFALGVRAVNARLRPSIGMRAILRGTTQDGATGWDCAWTVIRIDRGGEIKVHNGGYYKWPVLGSEFAPDLRDPGTKGHAVAQLRERTGDKELSTRCDIGEDENGARWVDWYVGSDEHGGLLTQAPRPCLTEEEAIVAAFEATKETP